MAKIPQKKSGKCLDFNQQFDKRVVFNRNWDDCADMERS